MFLSLDFRKAKKILLFILVLAVCLIFAVTVFKRIFPLRYYDIIEKYAVQNNIEPSLICGIINAESRFHFDAKSSKNAEGLMQLRQITAEWGAEELKLDNFDYANISDPDINIKIGTWYIGKLQKQFNNTNTALAAYNAGSGTVSQWLDDKNISLDGETLDTIPYKETRNYVKKVNFYKFVYDIIIDYKLY